MTLLILCVCVAVFVAPAAARGESAIERMPSAETAVPLLQERDRSETECLHEMFDWFDRVDIVGGNALFMHLRRANENRIRVNTKPDSRAWEYISPAKPITIKPGEQIEAWVLDVTIEIAFDVDLFPVSGCSWMSNAVHKIFVLWSREDELGNVKEKRHYVFSPDLRKAFCLEGGKDIGYPFPFANAKPNLSVEEARNQELTETVTRIVNEKVSALLDRLETKEPNKIYCTETARGGGVRYAVFDDDGRSLSCAEYYPDAESLSARVVLLKHCPATQSDSIIWLRSNGSLTPCDVVEGGKYRENDDASFKRAFARGVLTRLKLTAADLPGINLDAILGEPEAKK